MIVTSDLVVDADLLDTNIDKNETVVELQRVAVEVFCHVGIGVSEEMENSRIWLAGSEDLNLESSGMNLCALDNGVVVGGGQGGGVEGFRLFKVCNTLDVGLQDVNSGC